VETNIVNTQLEDRGHLGREHGGGVTLDGLTRGGDRGVVLDRAPIDLARAGGEEHVGTDAGQRRERAVEIAVDRQHGPDYLSTILNYFLLDDTTKRE
jgi:hypothetical protein